ncbi:hypothetical protein [Clostridium perfringens]|uniref:hypothetical protein n=1 Tax=Clostridium perfringens TaxID=1502 RepID=UPI0039E80EF9
MKSTNIILAKTLSCALITGILTTTSLPTQTTYAANLNNIQKSQSYKTGVIYEDKDFKITQTENERIVLDKKTSKNTILTFTDSTHSKGTYKDAEGNIKKYSKDENGNVYLDGECVLEVTQSIESEGKNKNFRSFARSRSYTNPNYFVGKNGYKYYYVTTYTYNTKTAGEATSIALGILSFIPYVGPTLFGVAGIIETARNLGAPTLYVKQKVYCTSDYSNYAYKNYFYSDANHSNLIDSNTVYKKMW